ncbi:MAG: hypothetical protein ACJZ1Q_05670 [Candidatus Neomarinimicrobiota bacterium]
MKIILILILSTILFSDSIKFIHYDLVDQFGVVSNDGGVLWNEDWYSNGLLFDGTWTNFPWTYGPLIKKGYLKKTVNIEKEDSNSVHSFFNYEQGDYRLDKFTLGLKYKNNSRNIHLNGFKRNYSGPYNQYYNNTTQPIQQSYFFSYDSKKSGESGGIKIGHFNTFSNLADSNSKGLISSRITSSNIFYNLISDNIELFTNVDQFMQRYHAMHSISYFENVRYLSRSRFFLGVKLINNSENYLYSKIKYNVRNVNIGYGYFNSWIKTDIVGRKDWIEVNVGMIRIKNNFDYNYKIKLNKKNNTFEWNFENSRINKVIHPIYKFYKTDLFNLNNDLIYQIKSSKASLSWFGKNMRIYSSFSTFNESKNKLINNQLKNYFMSLNFNYKVKLLSLYDIEFDYNLQDPNSYYSGGYGNWIELNSHSKINLFKNYMDINFIFGFQHIGNRINNSYLNIIEMIPINQYSDEKLEDINYLSSEMSIEVSDFIIKYKWKNISEIILNGFGLKSNNLFEVHPEMPSIGRQVNLSIEWHFKD